MQAASLWSSPSTRSPSPSPSGAPSPSPSGASASRVAWLVVPVGVLCTSLVHAQPAQPAPVPVPVPVDDGASAEAARARPARPMALREVLDAVVQRNPELARSRSEVATAQADALATLGVDDWTLSVTGAWTSTRSEFVDGQPFQQIKNDTFSIAAAIDRALPTGGTVKLDLDTSYSDTTFAVLGEGGMRFDIAAGALSASLVASVTQPLLGGRGERIARAEQRKARVARDAAALRREIAALDTVRDVVQAYWELAYAAAAVDIQRGSLELAREQLKITEAAVRGDVAAPAELLAVRHAIAVREQAVMLAQVEVSERSLALRRLAGLEIGPGEIDLEATGELASPAGGASAPGAANAALAAGGTSGLSGIGPGGLDAAIAKARAANPRLELARTTGEVAAIDAEVAEDAMRPRLDLTARVGPTGNATEAGDALRQFATFQAFTAGANLTYRASLGQRAARGGRDRAHEAIQLARIDRAEAERELTVAVVRAVDLVRVAHKRIEVSELEIQLSEQNLANERTLVQAGEARNFDVLARQDELAQARLSRARALADYRRAATELESLTGDLLATAGVELIDR